MNNEISQRSARFTRKSRRANHDGSAANHDDICMGQERRSSLALMHIHYQVKIDLDEVVNLFATKHPQRLELGTILKD